MTFQQELSSWFSPNISNVASESPSVGSKAPESPKLSLGDGKPTIIAFLRHAGCPFAEKTFLNLREAAHKHRDLSFVALSHSSESATDTWLKSLPQAGSEPFNLTIIVDEQKELYAAWGLGVSSFAHVLNPSSLYAVFDLGRSEGIWNRPTESGSRWQTSGYFAVDGEGVVRWGRKAESADDVTDFVEGVRVLEEGQDGNAKL